VVRIGHEEFGSHSLRVLRPLVVQGGHRLRQPIVVATFAVGIAGM
jgi:hypothetical protein